MLLLFAPHRHEVHARSPHRLADCFCIGRVVLAALEVGLDVARRHQPDLVAERDQFTRPTVRSRARLDTDQARSEQVKNSSRSIGRAEKLASSRWAHSLAKTRSQSDIQGRNRGQSHSRHVMSGQAVTRIQRKLAMTLQPAERLYEERF